MRIGSLAVVAFGALVAVGARADTPPSAWDRAKDPAAAERYRLHERIETMRHPWPPMSRERLLELYDRARTLLEEASAATSPDVRLRFDLGEVYEYLDRHADAIRVLQAALALEPDSPAAPDAWESLAYAAAKLDQSSLERDAYDAYLALAQGGDSLNIRGNRAEAEMRLGNLDAAIEGYKDVIYRCEHVSFGHACNEQTLVLARWGLAVALDRNGDPAGSASVAANAVAEDPDEQIIGDRENVFFVPDYERDWYYGIGRAERARHEPDPKRAVAIWTLTLHTWLDYLARATPDDRWRPLAHAHAADAEAHLRVARTRLPTPSATPRASSSRAVRR
jgi:tetratricopeptide (TPR) repeat protein